MVAAMSIAGDAEAGGTVMRAKLSRRGGRAGRDRASSVLRLTIGQKAAKLNGAQMQ